MSIIRLNNLGFTSPSSDIDPSSLTPEVFSNAINFRSIDDKLISSNGKTELYAPAANFSVGNAFFVKPRHIRPLGNQLLFEATQFV